MVADRAQVTSELSRELSLFHIIMMALGMMVGAGVFLGVLLALGLDTEDREVLGLLTRRLRR